MTAAHETMAIIVWVTFVILTLFAMQSSSQTLGNWQTLGDSGIPAVHLTLMTPTKVMIINRDDTPTPFLPGNTSAFTAEYYLQSNKYRLIPMHKGQPGCATGVFLTNGSLLTTGGKIGGANGAGEYIRLYTPNDANDAIWNEDFHEITTYRWYSSAVTMPSTEVLLVGGSLDATKDPASNNPTYEFIPPNPKVGVTNLDFLTTSLPYALYPALYIMPDGNVWIFVNNASMIWDPYSNAVVKSLPQIPDAARTYPLTGSIIMLPLKSSNNYTPKFLVCGGQPKQDANLTAVTSCYTIVPTDQNPTWMRDDDLPQPRIMGDSIVLPTGKILIINGAQKGFAGYGPTPAQPDAFDPDFSPVVYDPDAPAGQRFSSSFAASNIPRMYHSAALLLPDARILVGGSSSNDPICITASPSCVYPTSFTLEAFSPPYLMSSSPRPVIDNVPNTPWLFGYGSTVVISVSKLTQFTGVTAIIINTGFATHTSHFDQRAIYLDITIGQAYSNGSYPILLTIPPNANVSPPSTVWYLYIVSGDGVPSIGAQVSIIADNPVLHDALPNGPLGTSPVILVNNGTNNTTNSTTNNSSHTNDALQLNSGRWMYTAGLFTLFALLNAL